MTTAIWTTIIVTGFHLWGSAPEDIAFLNSTHRHRFYIRATLDVTDPNREYEFFQVQRKLRRALNKLYKTNSAGEYDFGSRSCEMIGLDILRVYPELSSVEVSEDNESGALCSR